MDIILHSVVRGLRSRVRLRGAGHGERIRIACVSCAWFAFGCGVAAEGGTVDEFSPSAANPLACHVDGLLPDSRCTPGAAQTSDLGVICGTSTDLRRDVSEVTRERAFAQYGLSPHHAPGAYELDHLIPLELGGSNDMANLWPEAAPGFHQKDQVEDFLHDSVCSGSMGVEDAQRAIAADWTQFAPR
ncbi:MAG: hypothetical protein ABTD50_13185 [Polyangiaceae bacterium]|jgi:hypothetical protein